MKQAGHPLLYNFFFAIFIINGEKHEHSQFLQDEIWKNLRCGGRCFGVNLSFHKSLKIHLLIFCACEMSHLSESMTPFSWCEIQVDKITATRDAYSFMGFYSVSYRNSFFSNESRELIGSTSQCELCIDHEWFVIKFFDKQIDLNSLFYVFFFQESIWKDTKSIIMYCTPFVNKDGPDNVGARPGSGQVASG